MTDAIAFDVERGLCIQMAAKFHLKTIAIAPVVAYWSLCWLFIELNNRLVNSPMGAIIPRYMPDYIINGSHSTNGGGVQT